MYDAHFGFAEKPFSPLPDPAFLFLGRQHSAALSVLEYSLETQAGFAVLTGTIGSGKTTLVRHLLEHAARDLVVGLVSNTHPSFGDLLTWVLLAFGLSPAAGQSRAQAYQAFVDFLLEQYAQNRRTVLIVDEAQNLGTEALEELRLLSNINADKHQVVQTILVGQPELRGLLQQPELSQFAQRISAHFHLEPLDQPETGAYIRHRLTLAGGDPELFEPAACALVHRYSAGVPRVVNVICDTALIYGYGARLTQIRADLVQEVVRDKVHAGLFVLPEGIAREELARSASLKRAVTAPEGTASATTKGNGAVEPARSEHTQANTPGRPTAPPQAEAAVALPEGAPDPTRPEPSHNVSIAGQGVSVASSLGAPQATSPMGLAASPPKQNAATVPRHPLQAGPGRRAVDARGAVPKQVSAARIGRAHVRDKLLSDRADVWKNQIRSWASGWVSKASRRALAAANGMRHAERLSAARRRWLGAGSRASRWVSNACRRALAAANGMRQADRLSAARRRWLGAGSQASRWVSSSSRRALAAANGVREADRLSAARRRWLGAGSQASSWVASSSRRALAGAKGIRRAEGPSEARRQWLVAGLGLMAVYIAVRGLQPREVPAPLANVEQLTAPALQAAPADRLSIENGVNETPVVAAVFKVDTGEPVDESRKEPSRSPEPARAIEPIGAFEDATPPDAPTTGPDDAQADDAQADDAQQRVDTVMNAHSNEEVGDGRMAVAATDEPTALVASVANDNARDAPPAEVSSTAEPAPATPPPPQETDAVSNSKNAGKIARLLVLANEALGEDRLTIPKGRSAYDYYQRLVELDAEDARASGIRDRIVQRYTAMARSALRRQDYVKATRYMKRGFKVEPYNLELLAVKREIIKTIP